MKRLRIELFISTDGSGHGRYSFDFECPDRIVTWIVQEVLACMDHIRRLVSFSQAKGEF
jgi:hypothetical protein